MTTKSEELLLEEIRNLFPDVVVKQSSYQDTPYYFAVYANERALQTESVIGYSYFSRNSAIIDAAYKLGIPVEQ